MMKVSLSLPESSQPREGDIVVAPETDSPTVWIVRRHGGPAEIAAQTRQDAIMIADSVAKELAVDVWSLDLGVYRALKTHRQGERMGQPKAIRRA